MSQAIDTLITSNYLRPNDPEREEPAGSEPARPSRRGIAKVLLTAPLAALGVHYMLRPGPPPPKAETNFAAVPITTELLLNYGDWLHMERKLLFMELFPDREERRFAENLIHTGNSQGGRYHLPSVYEDGKDWRDLPQPSTRAAMVLATVGCDWRKPLTESGRG